MECVQEAQERERRERRERRESRESRERKERRERYKGKAISRKLPSGSTRRVKRLLEI